MNMEKWIKDRLSICLDFEVPDDMIKYIMSMKSSEELNEYLSDLLNPEYEEHRIFMVDCKQRMFSKAVPNKKASNQAQQSKPQQNTKKYDKSATNAESGGKRKTKYTNLFTEDGKLPNTILLKGRRPCECEATEHRLVNNCLGCGRIVCEQEGSGPCLFCGELVCTNDEIQQIKTSKKGDNLKKSLEEKGGGESLRKALEQRDRLLEYDRNSEKRTEVIDDENDYFQDNSTWLSDEERKKLQSLQKEMHDMKHASRSSRKHKMDLFGREIEEDVIPEGYEQKVRKEINETLSKTHNWSSGKSQKTDDGSFDTRDDLPKPAFVNVGPQSKNVECIGDLTIRPDGRVQDKELLEMTDLRQCLSMHQPYASLLVEGIKKHEGRVWYTSHRGRLWIASTVKEPKREEIREVEDFYKKYYNDDSIKFPSQYQTGCLLGCVSVNDVLTQEEYRKRFPNGESESPYVFVCSDPQTLPVVFPIKGSHKLYQIEPKIHKAASLAIMNKKT